MPSAQGLIVRGRPIALQQPPAPIQSFRKTRIRGRRTKRSSCLGLSLGLRLSRKNCYQITGIRPDSRMLASLVRRATVSPRSIRRRAVATICRSCISVTDVKDDDLFNTVRSSGRTLTRGSASTASRKGPLLGILVLPCSIIQQASANTMIGRINALSGSWRIVLACEPRRGFSSKNQMRVWVSTTYLVVILTFRLSTPLSGQKILLCGHVISSKLAIAEIAS